MVIVQDHILRFCSLLLSFLIGSPLRSYVSSAIIKLNEEGIIQRLKNKWWKNENGEQCNAGGGDSEAGSGSVNELGLPNVGGIFLVFHHLFLSL